MSQNRFYFVLLLSFDQNGWRWLLLPCDSMLQKRVRTTTTVLPYGNVECGSPKGRGINKDELVHSLWTTCVPEAIKQKEKTKGAKLQKRSPKKELRETPTMVGLRFTTPNAHCPPHTTPIEQQPQQPLSNSDPATTH